MNLDAAPIEGAAELADGYEVLRAAALGTSDPTSAPVGLGVFQVRGMIGWAAALPTLAASAETPTIRRQDAPVARTRSELVHVLADMMIRAGGAA